MKKLYTLLFGLVLSLAASAQCSEIFFSEYIEGSGNNKAVEIYNPSSSTIDLSDYVFFRFNNGSSTASDSFFSNAQIAPADVYVIANPSAIAAFLAVADTTHTLTFYNGDDVVMIVNRTTGDTVDVIGLLGNDPGTNWSVDGGGATSEFTLVRKETVKSGINDWSVVATQWDVYTQNTSTYLGTHTSDCHPPTTPEVSFASASVSVAEDAGSITLNVSIASPSTSIATKVDVSISGGSAVAGTDYSSSLPVTLTFPAGSSTSQQVTITLIDNSVANPNKTIELVLSNVSTGAVLGKDSVMVLTIANDDYQISTIADVKMPDADLAPTNLDALYEITGVVYGIDFDGNAGLSFTLIDATGGINIFNFVDVSDYVVTEGDNITARGKIAFYRGLLELLVDSIKVNSQGNALKAPTAVDVVSEATESDYIKLNKVWIADGTTTWPTNGNVWLTNKQMDTFQIRIDADAVDIIGTTVMYDTMTIYGIGGQFDPTAPYDEGYQIFASRLADIQEWIAPSKVTFKVDMSRFMNDGGTFGTVNLNGTFNEWCGACITMTDDDNDKVYEVTVDLPQGDIEFKYTLDGWDKQEEFKGGEACTVTKDGFTNRFLTITGDVTVPVNCYNKCITCAEAIATVEDKTVSLISVYPNPTSSTLNIESAENWISYEVYSVLGVKVSEGRLSNNSISVADINTGTYFIKLTSDNKTGEARFVVSR